MFSREEKKIKLLQLVVVGIVSSTPDGVFVFHYRVLLISQLSLNHFPLRWGGGGRGLDAMGTQPIAAARAKGNQAATDAISHFLSFKVQFYLAAAGRGADWLYGRDWSRVLFWRPILDLQYCISKNLTNCIDLIVFDIFFRTGLTNLITLSMIYSWSPWLGWLCGWWRWEREMIVIRSGPH